MDLMRGSSDEQLDQLFRAYREACPTPEAGPNFMPQLWQKIESRQTLGFTLRRFASAFVTAAVAASLALGVYMAIPRTPAPNASYYSSYVEALAAANTIDTPDIVAPVRLDLGEK
ncbi:MAG TPA: hypothetical protein VLY24_10565 [Bryobacteraceae bacterium]|nr:hypothetical protein [Bryobacteraceae bacterium]